MKFFPERKARRIASEATRWLLRLEQDEAGSAPAFAEWLLRSPDHVREFLLATTFLEDVALAWVPTAGSRHGWR